MEAMERKQQIGSVSLVGAGPGDPDLITRKGLRCLQTADVVVYDRLVNLALLDEVPYSAERVFVGKQAGCHYVKQEQINELLIDYARQGKHVVRLKGGDPFVFGRGGEEVIALAQAGIPFEVVPGISSAMAVPACAGIPVTHRNLASSVTIVTGHEHHNKAGVEVDWETLAKVGGTLVILMGVEGLAEITSRLVVGGLASNTPAAMIQQGTTPQQRVVTGMLETIATQAKEAGIKAPAITVIGGVAALSETLSEWFVPTELGKKEDEGRLGNLSRGQVFRDHTSRKVSSVVV
jgi:uroporphyrin-III C-methyltransferase